MTLSLLFLPALILALLTIDLVIARRRACACTRELLATQRAARREYAEYLYTFRE